MTKWVSQVPSVPGSEDLKRQRQSPRPLIAITLVLQSHLYHHSAASITHFFRHSSKTKAPVFSFSFCIEATFHLCADLYLCVPSLYCTHPRPQSTRFPPCPDLTTFPFFVHHHLSFTPTLSTITSLSPLPHPIPPSLPMSRPSSQMKDDGQLL